MQGHIIAQANLNASQHYNMYLYRIIVFYKEDLKEPSVLHSVISSAAWEFIPFTNCEGEK